MFWVPFTYLEKRVEEKVRSNFIEKLQTFIAFWGMAKCFRKMLY